MTAGDPLYGRVLLKLSGEAFGDPKISGIDSGAVARISAEVKSAAQMGVQIALVVGGGNFTRRMLPPASTFDRVSADNMGMLATIINALALQDFLERSGAETRVMSAIPMRPLCEPYIHRRAMRHMEKGRILIFAGGTGNPYFTTDTAAALRAMEIRCDALFKATQVDGVYSDDPLKNPAAKRYDRLTYQDVLSRNLKVMDGAAVSLCRDNDVPVIVFSISEEGAFTRALSGRGRRTSIAAE